MLQVAGQTQSLSQLKAAEEHQLSAEGRRVGCILGSENGRLMSCSDEISLLRALHCWSKS